MHNQQILENAFESGMKSLIRFESTREKTTLLKFLKNFKK